MFKDAALLFGVKLVQTLLRHAVNKEMVADLRVCIDALTVSLGYTLCKNARVFGVEQQINTVKAHHVSGAIPETSVLLVLSIIAINQHWSPVANAIFFLVKALAWDRAETTVRLLSI